MGDGGQGLVANLHFLGVALLVIEHGQYFNCGLIDSDCAVYIANAFVVAIFDLVAGAGHSVSGQC